MKKFILLWASLMAAGCYVYGDNESPTGPDLTLYYAVCVDSTVVHPTYRCVPPDTAWIVLTIPNPNPRP